MNATNSYRGFYYGIICGIIGFFMIAVITLAILTAKGQAQHGLGGRYSNVFVTHEYEMVGSTSGVVAAIPGGVINDDGLQKSQRAYIIFEGQGVRWTADGTTPSTTVGIPVAVGGSIVLVSNEDINNFQFVNDDDTGTATAHISLQYEKEMR